MRTLLDERFAPITSSIGFLELPIDQVAAGIERWRRSLYTRVDIVQPSEGFPEVLRRLEPLMAGVPRELVVAAGRWTAYFDNSLHGTDAVPPIGYLSEQLGCQGLAVRAVPHTVGLPDLGHGRYGSVQFQLFGPLRTDYINYVRTLAAACDGNRWVFVATGTEQPFEEFEAYQKRRVRDRFTSEMLERYCQALGIDVFNPDIYGPDAVFFESAVPLPPNPRTMTLEQAQKEMGIVPGMAQQLPA